MAFLRKKRVFSLYDAGFAGFLAAFKNIKLLLFLNLQTSLRNWPATSILRWKSMTSCLPPECLSDPQYRCFVVFEVAVVVACLNDFYIRAAGESDVSIRTGCLLMV